MHSERAPTAGLAVNFAAYPFAWARHPAALPPMSGGIERQRHPVAIVGAGPVGLCVALGLASHGVRSVLIEADDSVSTGSRAICISRRSLEIIARLGALEGYLRIGLPWSGGRSFYRGAEVLRFTMPQDENQRLPPMLNLAQYHIEQILLDHAEQLAEMIDLRWQTKLEGIEPLIDGARLRLATPLGNYRLDADWLVAADGGRSTVRESLGLAMHGTSYEGRYVIVDILLDSKRPTERLAYFDPPCNPGSTVLVHRQPQNVWRIDYQLRDGEDADAALEPRNVMPRVASVLDMMGERGSWSPIWITLYKANALTLDRYRHGRALLAGDAAHLVPIFGVRGVNSGIDDADNLAWKLACVAKGQASARLLDSYSDERVAAARENLAYGAKSTEFMAPPSFAFALMRNAVLGLAVKHACVRSLINPRQTSPIAYTDSPLNRALDSSREFAEGPPPGAPLPECPLTIAGGWAGAEPRPGHVTELLGPRFTLFQFGETLGIPGELQHLERTLNARGVPFAVVPLLRSRAAGGPLLHAWDHTGRLFPMYGAAADTLYLVRPDGHVLARWRRTSAASVAAAIDQVMNCRGTQGAVHD
ncbi:MAG TPA: FAD-dependent oxidoreductase [Steroidobacteraceae bacterium]|nr:FAD-dependent oxidoreductase [Steroidobacteraceae bacterium]